MAHPPTRPAAEDPIEDPHDEAPDFAEIEAPPLEPTDVGVDAARRAARKADLS